MSQSIIDQVGVVAAKNLVRSAVRLLSVERKRGILYFGSFCDSRAVKKDSLTFKRR